MGEHQSRSTFYQVGKITQRHGTLRHYNMTLSIFCLIDDKDLYTRISPWSEPHDQKLNFLFEFTIDKIKEI